MFCIYLSIAFFAAGIGVWFAGRRVDKKTRQQPRSHRKKLQRQSEKLGNISRTLFVLCALAFVLGFIMLQGAAM